MARQSRLVVAKQKTLPTTTLPRYLLHGLPPQYCGPKTAVYTAPNAPTAVPKATTKIVVTTASVAVLEGVFILSGDVASCSDGTDGSFSSQREYRSFTPWYVAPSWSRARYLDKVLRAAGVPTL